MEDLLQQYEGLFTAPTGLSPDPQHCDRIHLQPGTRAVAV
jgi:hypothetical protein